MIKSLGRISLIFLYLETNHPENMNQDLIEIKKSIRVLKNKIDNLQLIDINEKSILTIYDVAK